MSHMSTSRSQQFYDETRCFDVNTLSFSSYARGDRIDENTGNKLDDNEWLHQQAKLLMEECFHHPRINRESNTYSTLYCGRLGSDAFLRLKWAKTLSKNSQQTERIETLRQARRAAVEALEECSSISSRFIVTLLEGKWVGATSVLAATEYHLGHTGKAKEHCLELLRVLRYECSRLPPQECEVLYGRSGAMQAILFLRSECQDATLGTDLMSDLANDILVQGTQDANVFNAKHKETMPLMWQWHGKYYLGAAHGVVGILTTLLQMTPCDWEGVDCKLHWSESQSTSPIHLIQATLERLTENFLMLSGNLQSSVGSDSDRLVHWCHGAPGLCLLLIKASSVFQATDHNSAQKYTAMAMKLADEVVWPRGLLKKGTGLCHGISGNGYVLLQLSKSLEGSTASKKWYKRAFMYASFAVANLNELKHVPDRPFSLYEGIAGLACYLLDCCDRGTGKSAFPLYEYS